MFFSLRSFSGGVALPTAFLAGPFLSMLYPPRQAIIFVAHNFVVYMCCLMLAAGYSYILEMKSSAILMYRLWHCTIECALY
jgi:hypothetical protein